MLKFTRVNQKGERVTAFTHSTYLTRHFHDEMTRIQQRDKKWVNTTLFGSTLISYFIATQVPVVSHFIQNKFSFKGRFIILPLAVGILDAFGVSLVLGNSLRNSYQNLLKNETFPIWYNKDNVVNPDRIFFEVDDDKHYEPNIYHSGIRTFSSIQRLIPDAIVGTPVKPHFPVAQHHNHH